MSDEEDLHHKFKEIIKKYQIDEPATAERIALFITSHPKGKFTIDEFAKEFGMEKEDVAFLVGWIYKSVEFKEKIK